MQVGIFQAERAVLPRRQLIKGLAATALTLGLAGCSTSSASSGTAPTPGSTPTHQAGKILYLYQGHSDQVLTTAWAPDSQRVASGSRDGTAQVWDALTGNHAYIYRGHTQPVAAVTWSPDGKAIASGAWDGTVQIWDANTGATRLTYHKHSADLTSVAWSPDGKYIASGSADKTVQVWDATTGQLAQTYRGHTAVLTAALWSPNGQSIASSSADKTVQVWDALTGKRQLTFTGHSERVTAISWSPDGKYIASGSSDKTVQVWNATTGQVLYIYSGYNVAQAHQNPTKGVLPDLIYAVDWSHNGQWIAAVTQIYCGDDCGEVLIWDALTQKNFKFFPTQPMYTLVISPNDTYLASSTGLSQVQVALAP